MHITYFHHNAIQTEKHNDDVWPYIPTQSATKTRTNTHY